MDGCVQCKNRGDRAAATNHAADFVAAVTQQASRQDSACGYQRQSVHPQPYAQQFPMEQYPSYQ